MERAGWGRRGLRVSLLACLIASGLPSLGQAELRRVEAIGTFGIRDGARARVIPRDEAIARARWEAVSRVALELIGETGLDVLGVEGEGEGGDDGLGSEDPVVAPIDDRAPPRRAPEVRDSGDPEEDRLALLQSALGKDTLPYTRSYRILEDQGEGPVMFAEDPEVETEYVVVVEVIVDEDRVAQALERAGLISREGASGDARRITLELLGITRYAALERVVEVLTGPLGATRVQPLEFAPERQVLSVEGPFDLQGLSDRLAGYRDPRLVLEPIGVDAVGGRIRVLGRWFPEPPASESPPAAVGARRRR